MADLDVSDIILDPDFSQPIVIQRNRISTVNGIGLSEPYQLQAVAVVVPAGSIELNRLPDAEMVKGRVHIYTQFPLTSGDDGLTADIVLWRGRSYTVSAVDDYTQFGVGFVDATADLLPTHNQVG